MSRNVTKKEIEQILKCMHYVISGYNEQNPECGKLQDMAHFLLFY